MDESLLDTDIVNEVLKRRDAIVLQHAATYLAQHRQFAISAITRYELLRGLKEKGAEQQLRNFDIFCQHTIIVVPDNAVLDRASDLWVAGRSGGHSVRDADLMIAATAIEHQRVLVTGNIAHFSWMPGVQIKNWREL